MKPPSSDGPIVLVFGSFPAESSFLLAKCAGLLRGDPRIRIVCLEPTARVHTRALRSGDAALVLRQTRFARQSQSRLLAALWFPVVLTSCLWHNPVGTVRYLVRGFRQFGLAVVRHLQRDSRLIEARPAIVHFEFGTLGVDRTHLGELLGCRMIVSFRGFDLNYAGLDRNDYYAKVWKHADVLHLLGNDLWTRAQTRGCPPEKPHVLIPPGVDTNFFDPAGRTHTEVAGAKTRPLRVLSVGRLVWKKGYEHALAAIRNAVNSGIAVEYRIVGDGDYLGAIAFARHQLGLDTSVELLGSLQPDAVREQMRWADVFLHAAVSEGFCNAVVEAQAMKLPVVCSDADGLAENVADGETGFVVPRRASEDMSRLLTTLATNPLLRQTMGDDGRRRAIALFSVGDQIAAFQGVYRQLCPRL